MHAEVHEHAAARLFLVKAPLLIVAWSPSVPIVATNVHEIAQFGSEAKGSMNGWMKPKVIADLDNQVSRFGLAVYFVYLILAYCPRFLDQHMLPDLDSGQCERSQHIVWRGDDHGINISLL